MNWTIRQETATDYKEIAALLNEAFGQSQEAQLVDALRAMDQFNSALALVAEHEQSIIGHILFTPIEIGPKKAVSLALGPMGVLPPFQKKGVGKKLIQAGLKAAKAEAYNSVIVLGHAEYYPKFGFLPASNWRIKAPFDVPDPVFMALELEHGSLGDVEGMVVYPTPFLAF